MNMIKAPPYTWLTDTHLIDTSPESIETFYTRLASSEAEVIFITGDISDGEDSFLHLERIATLNKPTYFVLGNHDFYHSSLQKTKDKANEISKKFPKLHYLTDNGIVELSEDTALIGHDSWADGRTGNYLESNLKVRDYIYIEDLIDLSPEERLPILMQLGDEAAASIRASLTKAFEKYTEVILLMHVPPFKEACLYKGRHANADWGPYFVCQAVGDVLNELMQYHHDKRVQVLCGHSHHPADVWMMPNLRITTAGATVGSPEVILSDTNSAL